MFRRGLIAGGIILSLQISYRHTVHVFSVMCLDVKIRDSYRKNTAFPIGGIHFNKDYSVLDTCTRYMSLQLHTCMYL